MPITTEELASDLKVQIAKADEQAKATACYRAKQDVWKERIEDKIDSMAEKLATLPCAVHVKVMEGIEKRLNSHSGHIGKLYALAGVVAIALVYSYIGHAFGK